MELILIVKDVWLEAAGNRSGQLFGDHQLLMGIPFKKSLNIDIQR